MVQRLKTCLLFAMLVLAGTRSVFGFSLLGPQVVDAFQITDIGYFERRPATTFENLGAGVDHGAPKNLGEGYRWNTRTLYYAYDGSFLDYFGSNGVVAVDKAFTQYNGLANLSSYSAGLTEFPLNSSRINFQAAALNLIDLKSMTMSLIIEQLGLAQPERWTWCLHDRYLPPGSQCPGYVYTVIQRNFDPISQVYSSYVNGVLYDFEVFELCGLTGNPYAPLLADAVEIAPDSSMLANGYGAVAAANISQISGQFYTTFTRDDIGGLRYLMSTNRINVEAAEPTSQQILTNTTQVQLLVTQDLSLLTQLAPTNDAATLATLIPGLLITQSSNYFSNVIVTNITAYFTNLPGTVVGSAPTPVLVTNFTTNVGTFFVHTFANVFTNHFYTNGTIVTTTTNVGPQNPGGVYTGQLVTNIHSVTNTARFINGDYYLIPANALCGNGFQILSTQLVSLTLTTNVFVVATNAPGSTNVLGQNFTFDIITFFTNYSLLVYPIQCLGGSNTVALREGIDKINFVRQDFDSLLNGFWQPVTNYYFLTAVTNNASFSQHFQRIANAPDIVLLAADLASGPAAPPDVPATVPSALTYNSAQALRGLAGPGTMQIGAGITFTYDKVGPAYVTGNGFFISGLPTFTDTNTTKTFFWGSFDGSTNPPIAYPDGTSLATLQSQIFFQITNSAPMIASLSSNTAAHPFSLQLGASGGFRPYTWSLTTNSPALPPGFGLTSGGLLQGVPTRQGVYDFEVQVTDNGLRVAKADLTIQVVP